MYITWPELPWGKMQLDFVVPIITIMRQNNEINIEFAVIMFILSSICLQTTGLHWCPTYSVSMSSPFWNDPALKLSTCFLLRWFLLFTQMWQQSHHFILCARYAPYHFTQWVQWISFIPLSNVPSWWSHCHIPLIIWWHHLCSLIMTNRPLNHSLGCYSIVHWTSLCKTAVNSVTFFWEEKKKNRTGVLPHAINKL